MSALLPAAHVPGVVALAEQVRQARHCADEFAPVAGWYVPAPHAWHAFDELAPLFGWYVPTPHARHAPDEMAPAPGWYVPTGHAWHATSSPPLYDPALQGWHSAYRISTSPDPPEAP